ncbi:polysaccharide biosynthesis protein [Prochlorococcus sp. AH-716-G10]|nr:polysaccharide biosynthesis protein [Prochlorococcus sp. AH-716-G10]
MHVFFITSLTFSSRIIFRDILLNQGTKLDNKTKKNVVIFGAGSAGCQLAVSLKLNQKYNIICFLDDDVNLSGRKIYGISIYNPSQLETLDYNIDLILLAIPSLKNQRRKEVIQRLHKFGKKVLQTPSMELITTGDSKINNLIPIDIEDLLGRNTIQASNDMLKGGIYNKTICITGAGGSIGSELSRQVASLKPHKLILIDNNEPSLYQISEEINKSFNNEINLIPIIGNTLNQIFLDQLFSSHKIDSVFHAAAYKHVPLVELNPLQGIENNVLSTKAICESCEKNYVGKMILISTDKAVRPHNVMGASKRVAELLVQSYSKRENKTCFSMVRFGNVLNSSGSVVPLFKKQINKGGPVTITHPEIIRYFMTIPEAAQLVIQAAFQAQGGEVFLLDMGKPLKISYLAKQLIELSGLKIKDINNPDGDIEIKYTGLRPGEKLFEELLVDGKAESTLHPLIYKSKEDFLETEQFWINIEELCKKIAFQDSDSVLNILKKLVPEWEPFINHELKN